MWLLDCVLTGPFTDVRPTHQFGFSPNADRSCWRARGNKCLKSILDIGPDHDFTAVSAAHSPHAYARGTAYYGLAILEET